MTTPPHPGLVFHRQDMLLAVPRCVKSVMKSTLQAPTCFQGKLLSYIPWLWVLTLFSSRGEKGARMLERDKEGRWLREGVSLGDESVWFLQEQTGIVVAAR